MNAPSVVVADTTPLNYLILIDRADLLAELFTEVLIPQAVLEKLQHPKAPTEVKQWLLSGDTVKKMRAAAAPISAPQL